ncbi:MAG: exosome complex protein Rrp42 [Candidatus Diapherotrites archaeon]|uniref:Exosome complex protein Rrp42 n=1 Tax=Candidatus Iainarchaeum sp. TaxID=3101447 RepID=A0A7J4IVU4_9ARCH|nr:MAG: exosome complex component RRP42 [archaeon GW2011_AR10]MBS3059707.1 exosome complex protein Rrp42 [Candidatus Diapherotrites archaeon]HIH07837.1 exosome complex protein Rrp42 [Candidatus Diapherotrites archaeon]
MSELLRVLRSEKLFAELKEGKRSDGRKLDEYRAVEITKDISKNANSSVRVRLGKTDVLCGFTFILGEPYPDMPNEGSISVTAELLSLAAPNFEAGPPREDAVELARVVDRGIRESKTLNFEEFCIKGGEKVLIGFIDLYVLNFDGNAFDACGIGAISSLLGAKFPKIEDDKIVKGEYAGKLKVSRKPILSTTAKVSGVLVTDPALEEEESSSARFSVAVTEDDYICAFQKGGLGAMTTKEVDECIDRAFKNSKQLRKLL